MNNMMPVLFVGHGSPMNAVEDNEYSQTWKELGRDLPKPQAILSVSAHWYTQGTRINDVENPRLIYDFYGFPKELYELSIMRQALQSLLILPENLLTRM